jgi:protein TonB
MYAFRVTDDADLAGFSFQRAPFVRHLESASSFTPSHGYCQQARRTDTRAALASVLAVGALFSALAWMNVAPDREKQQHIVTMDLVAPPPPQPAHAKPEAQAVDMPQMAEAPAAAPVAALPVELSPSPVSVPPTPIPPTPVPVPVAAAPAQKAPSGPVEVNDLGARLVSFSPPSYPLQSRRDMEEGTVTLALLVGLDGNVLDISVSGTSGFPRLDKAALEAVRKWRWSPMMRSGEAVMLRGSLKIPFTLKR